MRATDRPAQDLWQLGAPAIYKTVSNLSCARKLVGMCQGSKEEPAALPKSGSLSNPPPSSVPKPCLKKSSTSPLPRQPPPCQLHTPSTGRSNARVIKSGLSVSTPMAYECRTGVWFPPVICRVVNSRRASPGCQRYAYLMLLLSPEAFTTNLHLGFSHFSAFT